MMKKIVPAANPEAYVAGLDGWQHDCVAALRAEVRSSARLDEAVKWGHLVYSANGPVLLIRAGAQRVLFGFWRGKRLQEIEPRLKPSGKYEMATLELRENDKIEPKLVRQLTRKATVLNRSLGDPTEAVKAR